MQVRAILILSAAIFDLEEKKDLSYMRNDINCSVSMASPGSYISEKHYYKAWF